MYFAKKETVTFKVTVSLINPQVGLAKHPQQEQV
jgi:hypothetical protein